MSYFRLGSSSEDTVKFVLLILSILLIAIGASHFGYASLFQAIKIKQQQLRIITESDLTLLQGPTAVFVISGVLLIIISFISIFMVFGCIGNENRMKWISVMLGLLILEFGFTMAVALYNSLMYPFYSQTFIIILDLTQKQLDTFTQPTRSLYINIQRLHKYTLALTIINWVAAVPSIAIQLFALMSKFINDMKNGSNTVGGVSTTEIAKIPGQTV